MIILDETRYLRPVPIVADCYLKWISFILGDLVLSSIYYAILTVGSPGFEPVAEMRGERIISWIAGDSRAASQGSQHNTKDERQWRTLSCSIVAAGCPKVMLSKQK